MIRLSVTDLDSYLYWRDSEDMPLEELIARIQEPTPEMQAGRAFHHVLEHASTGELSKQQHDGWIFEFAVTSQIALPPIRELKGEVLIATPSGPVTLVGKVDGMVGRTVIDYKLTERFDAERYADSYQWRAYLAMFGGDTFRYEVFSCRYDGCRVVIHSHDTLRFNAYDHMRADLESKVAGLAEIVKNHVPEKIQEEAA